MFTMDLSILIIIVNIYIRDICAFTRHPHTHTHTHSEHKSYIYLIFNSKLDRTTTTPTINNLKGFEFIQIKRTMMNQIRNKKKVIYIYIKLEKNNKST